MSTGIPQPPADGGASNIAFATGNAAGRLAEMDAMTLEQRARFTYSDGNQSYDWTGYRNSLVAQLAQTPAMLAGAQAAAGPFEVHAGGGWW